MNEVLQVVDQAQKQFGTNSEKTEKTRKWIKAFASSISLYSNVIDVVVQADPLHAGLIWGAIKFVLSVRCSLGVCTMICSFYLKGVLNHAQMVTELSKALTKIGRALPRVQVNLSLYRTPWMQDTVSRLYAHILLFLQQAVKWYKLSIVRRTLNSVFRPYKLVFNDIVEEINACSETVDAIASTSGQAEIRGITQALQRIQESDQKLHAMQIQLNDMQAQNEIILSQVLQVTISKKIILSTKYC